MIDLRSDTVTQPTRAMREAMLTVEVGDDVYGEDPTVNALQARAAELMGKEAGLLVSSGTQGNLIAVLTHAPHGSEVIVGEMSHIPAWEQGGMAALGGLMPRVASDTDGTLRPEDVERLIQPDEQHVGHTALVCVENPLADRGGIPVPAARIQEVADVAHAHGLKVHMDGARIFNAAVALGVPAAELAAPVDSVTFCLSKGLGAPVGSVLCGSKAFIGQAFRRRKMLGSGMRQSGWIAVAGMVALDQHIDRLAEDHANAQLLGELLREIRGVRLAPDTVWTNMVFPDVSETGVTPEQVTARLKEEGVLVAPFDKQRLRLVTHLWITRQDVEQAAAAFARAVGA